MSGPDDQGDRRLPTAAELQELELRRARRESRQAWAVYILTAGVVVGVGWAMWRLDDRAERMLAVVSQERSAPCVCP